MYLSWIIDTQNNEHITIEYARHQDLEDYVEFLLKDSQGLYGLYSSFANIMVF